SVIRWRNKFKVWLGEAGVLESIDSFVALSPSPLPVALRSTERGSQRHTPSKSPTPSKSLESEGVAYFLSVGPGDESASFLSFSSSPLNPFLKFRIAEPSDDPS